MNYIYLDTETCGLYGMPVIIQYAFNDEPKIYIHEFWKVPIKDSLDLIERICECCVVGFNLSFDWFHLQKLHAVFSLFAKHNGDDLIPEDHIDAIAMYEKEARDCMCIKPLAAFDIMLHARKTKYQVTMARSDIRIRKVPTPLSLRLANELENRIEFADILFHRRKDKTAPKWTVQNRKKENGEIDENFKDVVLKFKASAALKALAADALGVDKNEIILYSSVEVDSHWYPTEFGYAPFAFGKKGEWKIKLKNKKTGITWPGVIEHHINHWNYHEAARKYASNDVDYTRRLYKYFDSPPVNDDDSVLACLVASVRWKGFAVDIEGIKQLKLTAQEKLKQYPIAPRQVMRYLKQVLNDTEQVGLTDTKKITLEHFVNDPIWDGHPVKERAQNVLDARGAKKEIELYDKLIRAGRFHASFKVIGALSSRMSGTDGLNPQGIKKTKQVRSKFPLADPGMVLGIGDFSAFEVVLAIAAWKAKSLSDAMQQRRPCHKCGATGKKKDKICDECNGTKETDTKIHALFGLHVYTHMSYEEILASSGTSDDKYTRSKSAVFAMMYGGEGFTLMTRLGVDLEQAEEAFKEFAKQYPEVGIARKKIYDNFCSMRQESGIGSRITWSEPAEYIESLLGFRRYFILENKICKALFNLAQKPPDTWKDIKIKVMRRERIQTVTGATQSALFGAAFQMQAANMRAAANHVIQSSGAQITKYVQRKIWDLQPHGIHPYRVQPANIHDEIFTPTMPEYVETVQKTVDSAVESFRDRVPLIKMDWGTAKTWADK